jgi:membrane-bound metal-dependent hydrolase YbcI (DUF457 family)
MALGAAIAAGPDLDMFLVPAGVDQVIAHRTFTHSLVSACAIALAVAAVQRFFGNAGRAVSRTLPLFVLVCLVSHIGLDIAGADDLGPQGLMLFWPFSHAYFNTGLDLFFSLRTPDGACPSFQAVAAIIGWELIVVTALGLAWLGIMHITMWASGGLPLGANAAQKRERGTCVSLDPPHVAVSKQSPWPSSE